VEWVTGRARLDSKGWRVDTSLPSLGHWIVGSVMSVVVSRVKGSGSSLGRFDPNGNSRTTRGGAKVFISGPGDRLNPGSYSFFWGGRHGPDGALRGATAPFPPTASMAVGVPRASALPPGIHNALEGLRPPAPVGPDTMVLPLCFLLLLLKTQILCVVFGTIVPECYFCGYHFLFSSQHHFLSNSVN